MRLKPRTVKGLKRMNRMRTGTKKNTIRIAAAMLAMLLAAGLPQAALTGYAANSLGSQGSALEGGGGEQSAPADGENTEGEEVQAIIDENSGEIATSTVAEIRIKEQNGVKVRAEASKDSAQVGALKKDVVIAVVGETTGSDGMVWYQVSGQNEGKQVDGYIRSDLVEVTATAQPEPAPVEPEPEPAPETPSTDPGASSANEYDVSYSDDGTGVNDWFLNDNINGNRYKISELLGAAQTNENNIDVMEGQTKNLRTIIIVLAVIIGLLVVVLTIMIFKLRNSYEDFGDDDDDDDYDGGYDDDDDEEEDDDEVYSAPVKRYGSLRNNSRRNDRSRYEDEEDEEEDDDERYDDEEEEEEDDRYSRKSSFKEPPRGRAGQARGRGGSRPRNFLNVDEDDEMDFEFLDLK